MSTTLSNAIQWVYSFQMLFKIEAVEKMNEVAMWLHQHYNGDADLEENWEQIAKDLLQ